MNEQAALMNQLRGLGFAAHELHLYLDTQPNDTSALSLYRQYMEQYMAALAEYERKFGPISTADVDLNNSWQWISDPWPWELDANLEA